MSTPIADDFAGIAARMKALDQPERIDPSARDVNMGKVYIRHEVGLTRQHAFGPAGAISSHRKMSPNRLNGAAIANKLRALIRDVCKSGRDPKNARIVLDEDSLHQLMHEGLDMFLPGRCDYRFQGVAIHVLPNCDAQVVRVEAARDLVVFGG